MISKRHQRINHYNIIQIGCGETNAHVHVSLRYVTRQLLGQFRSDRFISKLSVTVAVYRNKIYMGLFFEVEGSSAENV